MTTSLAEALIPTQTAGILWQHPAAHETILTRLIPSVNAESAKVPDEANPWDPQRFSYPYPRSNAGGLWHASDELAEKPARSLDGVGLMQNF